MKKIALVATCIMMVSCTMAQDIQLPAPDMNVKMTLMETLQKRASQREFSEREISDATLSQVLWAACGINRPESKKITAPSAINAQDILMYVARKDGAYLYQPLSNTLKKVCDKDLRDYVAANQTFAAKAPISLIMVTDLSKFGNLGTRAMQMADMDSGYVSENICLICTALGLNTVPRIGMNKQAISKELGLTELQIPLLNNPIGWPK
jgi:SagB-type dehydrogenase family enzyme